MRSETELPILRNEKFSLSLLSLYQFLGCDIPCVNRPSLSGNWLQTKSYSHSLPQVRFDMNSLSPNIQISRSCSDRQSLNSTREWRYCNNSEFEFPSWIGKSLFGAKAIVLRSPSMAILATLSKRHCLWIWSTFLDTISLQLHWTWPKREIHSFILFQKSISINFFGFDINIWYFWIRNFFFPDSKNYPPSIRWYPDSL